MPKVSSFTFVTPIPTGTRVPVLVPSGPNYIQRLVSAAELINANGGNLRVKTGQLQLQADDSLWYDVLLERSQGFTVMSIGQTGQA